MSLDEPELDNVLTFPSGYDTLEYSLVKATSVSVRLRILFVMLQNTNALPSAITWDELNNLAPSDCVKKRQQAFWRRCRGTVATLSTDSVVLVSSLFFLFDSTSTPATHGAAIPFTALFTQERVL